MVVMEGRKVQMRRAGVVVVGRRGGSGLLSVDRFLGASVKAGVGLSFLEQTRAN